MIEQATTRPAQVVFGRCCITGQWGKCITIDLGDISINTPNIEEGVEYNPETKEVAFNNWKPVIFQTQATVSEQGLEQMLANLRAQNNPIPSVSPELVYEWQATYEDGSALRQFGVDPETNEPVELNAGHIDFDRVVQMTVLPRYDGNLPSYSFVRETGKVYKNGEEIDLDYGGTYDPTAPVIYCRKVTQTWGSVMQQDGLNRNIENMANSVLQLIGWKVGGFSEGAGPGCIIAIDDRGNWRPWEYLE